MQSSVLLRVWPFLAAAAMAVYLGGYPLFDADEGRNGEVAREMAATNDYLVPRLDGMPYLDKPVAYFAAAAATMEILGTNELAARLPAYLFTLLTALLIAWFARRLWGAEEGWIAAGIFLTTPLVVAFARTVIFDSLLTFFTTGAIVAFYLAIEEKPRWSLAGWAAIGLGILTKGPVAILLPLLVAVPYGIKRKKARVLFSPAGIAICVLIVTPWVWRVSQEVPDFLRYVVVTETAARLATDTLQRTGPPWYFLPYLLGGALPWSAVALFGARKQQSLAESSGVRLFLLLWIAVPLIFFSLSQSKRPQYVLPLMPALALLSTIWWREGKRIAATRAAAAILLLLGALLIAAPFILPEMAPVIAKAAEEVAIPLGLCTAAAAVASLLFARYANLSLVTLSIPVLVIPLFTQPLMEALGERRSSSALARQMRAHLDPDTQVISIDNFSGSLAFYLQRPLTVVSDDGADLTSNYLLRRYDVFVDKPSSNLRSYRWLEQELASCCQKLLFVLRRKDSPRRAALEARGMRLLAEGAHHAVYLPPPTTIDRASAPGAAKTR